ncbi:Nin one binding Zn-ribbon like-domain-containing protein [Catenaria anguillulae PL171]|uniref:20S-pre-rRNA D-site endonuclease NOB1 n=1 Tax=Catenaria anguillulae PL171 TaxID=765915 RepID=A0A1Y2HKD0_9FUNG|nr:Nin one binding Zn-ribbon like-domain-containing protein [Catenaria anguillulae PL171]
MTIQTTHKTKTLVLDTAPLIKQTPLYHLADRFVATPDVLAEVRDAAAREALARLPFTIETRNPSEEAMAAVSAFAKLTGDFASLSVTDLRVIALTYDLTKEADGIEAILTEPKQPAQKKKKGGKKKNRMMTDEEFDEAVKANAEPEQQVQEQESAQDSSAADAGQGIESSEHDQIVLNSEPSPFAARVDDSELEAQLAEMALDDDAASVIAPSVTSTAASSSLDNVQFKQLPGFIEADSDNEEDDETGWITPDNVQKAKEITVNGSRTAADTQVPNVSCMSDDFAVQNVLLQMGMHLLSLDGIHVRRLKNWLLRCHACFRTTSEMERRFCPSCGGNTLIRTSYTIEDGVMHLHLKKNFQYKLRGTIFSIPNPKQGRNADNLILREDQHEFQVKQKNFQHLKKKQAKNQWDDRLFGDSPIRAPSIGFGSKNPNEARKLRK